MNFSNAIIFLDVVEDEVDDEIKVEDVDKFETHKKNRFMQKMGCPPPLLPQGRVKILLALHLWKYIEICTQWFTPPLPKWKPIYQSYTATKYTRDSNKFKLCTKFKS